MLNANEEKERKELKMSVEQFLNYQELQKEAKTFLRKRKTKEFRQKLEEINEYEKKCAFENKKQAKFDALDTFEKRPNLINNCRECLLDIEEGEIIESVRQV